MARNPVREQLLAEVKARRRAAGQKVSRLERSGIRVRKEGLDPRLSNSALEGMNARQLRSHLNRLNEFTSRSTGFVAGYRGVPLSARMWREYQRVEKIHNANAEAFYNRIRTLDIPGTGMTVEERLANLREQGTRAGDYRTFSPFERSASGITGQDSLKKLLDQMRKRADPRYLEREARLQRRIINKMLARTSNKDLIPSMRDLSDEEVITLAQYTDFMTTLESSYAMAKSTSSDTPRWQSSVYEDNEEKIHDWTDWAHNHFSTRQDSDETDDTSRSATTRGRKRVPFTPGTGDFNPVIDGATGVRTAPTRDRYGRFVGSQSLPDPTFARDERGRFKPGGGKFNPNIK